MLTVAEVDLPQSLQKRLREEAAFAESFAQYTREYLIGFRQPAAMAVAIIGPILFAFVYYTAGFLTLVEVGASFALVRCDVPAGRLVCKSSPHPRNVRTTD